MQWYMSICIHSHRNFNREIKRITEILTNLQRMLAGSWGRIRRTEAKDMCLCSNGHGGGGNMQQERGWGKPSEGETEKESEYQRDGAEAEACHDLLRSRAIRRGHCLGSPDPAGWLPGESGSSEVRPEELVHGSGWVRPGEFAIMGGRPWRRDLGRESPYHHIALNLSGQGYSKELISNFIDSLFNALNISSQLLSIVWTY